jgi:small conductance mechanosensitive channel
MSLFIATAAAEPAILVTLTEQVRSFLDGVLTLDPEQAAISAGLSLLVLIGAALVMLCLRLLLRALIERFAPADPDAATKRPRVGRWTMSVARLAVFVAAFLVILRVWGVDLAELTNGPFGVVLGVAGRLALIVVLSLAAIEISQLAIRQLFSRVADRARSMRRASQIRTLAPVLSGVATSALVIAAAMMALSEVGVEIGPLLAGAGIVGLAVGFGAQTLVKDFLTGIFLIIEDTVSVGDVAKIGDATGTVEDMSLRTIKLRAFDGTLQVIPYGEAQIIYNLTKGFSYYVFELSVAYSADLAMALELMKRTGDEMQTDPEFGSLILEPIEVVGVDQLADSGVVLKARIKTLPIKQWAVGREYLKRIKLAFDANGIEIPFPHIKLVAPDTPAP